MLTFIVTAFNVLAIVPEITVLNVQAGLSGAPNEGVASHYKRAHFNQLVYIFLVCNFSYSPAVHSNLMVNTVTMMASLPC